MCHHNGLLAIPNAMAVLNNVIHTLELSDKMPYDLLYGVVSELANRSITPHFMRISRYFCDLTHWNLTSASILIIIKFKWYMSPCV